MLTHRLSPILTRIGVLLLPWRCQLCGQAGSEGIDLCPACMADLPWNNIACARCGIPLPHPVPCCGQCLKRPPPFDATFALFRYRPPLDRLLPRFKFHGDLASGQTLAHLMARWIALPPAIDALVPVPLHTSRLGTRGYNQALELARPLAAASGVPLLAGLLKRVKPTAPQSELDRRQRQRNVRAAFTVPEGVSAPARVALIDDIVTTGATVAACAGALKQAGAQWVEVWAIARAPAPRS